MEIFSILKRMLINISEKVEKYPLTIFSIYLSSHFIYRDFGIKLSIGFCLLGMLFFMHAIKILFVDREVIFYEPKKIYLFYTLAIFILFMRFDAIKDKDNMAFILMMLLTLFTVFSTKESKHDIKISFAIIYLMSLVFSITIIYFQIFQDQYWQSIYPLLSTTAQFYAKNYFFKGYSMSFGGISYTLYMVVFGFLSTLSYLLYMRPSRKYRIISYFSLMLFFAVMIISGRRGELLSIMISLLVLFFMSASREILAKRVKVFVFVLLIFIIVSIAMFPYLKQIKSLQRHILTIQVILGQVEIEGGIGSGRMILYEKAWSMFKSKPSFGHGWGQFSYVSSNILKSAEGKGMHVHNSILQLLAETGLIGTILVLAPCLYLYFNTLTNFSWAVKNNEDDDRWIKYTGTLSMTLQTFFIITSLVDPINYKVVFWPMFYASFYLYVYSSFNFSPYATKIKIDFERKEVDTYKI